MEWGEIHSIKDTIEAVKRLQTVAYLLDQSVCFVAQTIPGLNILVVRLVFIDKFINRKRFMWITAIETSCKSRSQTTSENLAASLELHKDLLRDVSFKNMRDYEVLISEVKKHIGE